jgi:hypothetical protein
LHRTRGRLVCHQLQINAVEPSDGIGCFVDGVGYFVGAAFSRDIAAGLQGKSRLWERRDAAPTNEVDLNQ